jgi:hypothetical protein
MIYFFSGCSEKIGDSSLTSPGQDYKTDKSRNDNKTINLAKNTVISPGDLRIVFPGDGWSWSSPEFYWTKAKQQWTDLDFLYNFCYYYIAIDGYYIRTMKSGHINDTVADFTDYYPEIYDGNIHTVQVYAMFNYDQQGNLKYFSYGYNVGQEFHVRLGLKTPLISSQNINNHPSFSWQSIPGATTYFILCADNSDDFQCIDIIEANSYSDTRYVVNTAQRTLRYKIMAVYNNVAYPTAGALAHSEYSNILTINLSENSGGGNSDQ